ncbi:peptide ABC transporter substrate-binding protein [Neosynechococcus sphagnicola sy1]|uniref:Peptide ABC transporter substrate-binding protein n=1 Tax=Neosynechococcus sphagnicola sy1 TaxID=1497020 RepID=A0A098TIJ4_9CYAN|nr:ABC transporter substrate-binding protein [Neosynechococcus sphagnicola]KGF71802.1 peptide ABC transporter substrate-binding protein [Neosynechococcus sphagnicola sy1]
MISAAVSLLRRWLLVGFSLLLASGLSACNPDQLRTNATQVPELVAPTLGDPKTFNYPLNQESPNVFTYIYEGLITENGVTGEIEPALAESWKFSADKKQIVFTLREHLKWSDGQPLTAADVVFTYNSIFFNNQIPTDARDVLRIGTSRALPHVQQLDQRRIEFTVPEPFAPFLRSTGLPILPEHVLRPLVETVDSDGKPRLLSAWGTNTPPEQIICNGPFMIERYTTSQRVIFKRNPYYWRHDEQGQPLPYIERFVWQIVESTDTALLQFRSGSLDVLNISPLTFSLLKREEQRGKFTIYNGGPASGTTFISFNLNQGHRPNGQPLVDPIKSRWFNTLAFRQAIAYAIDRQTLINNIYRGLGELQNSPISVQSPYYLSPDQGLRVYNYDLEKAKNLLKKSGFRYSNQGQLLDVQGNRVRFTLLANTGSRTAEAICAQIKQDLAKIGIQVDLNFINFNVLVDKLSNSLEWECYFLGFTGGVEPNDGANIWSPEGGLHTFNQKPQAGQLPLVGRVVTDWEQEIGQLYIQGAQELDETKRKAIYAKTQKITQEYLPFIYLINPLTLAAVRNHVQGVQVSGLGGTLWNIQQLKIVADS